MTSDDVKTLPDALVWWPRADIESGGDWPPRNWLHLLGQEVDQVVSRPTR